jgi:hypothetical protein
MISGGGSDQYVFAAIPPRAMFGHGQIELERSGAEGVRADRFLWLGVRPRDIRKCGARAGGEEPLKVEFVLGEGRAVQVRLDPCPEPGIGECAGHSAGQPFEPCLIEGGRAAARE